MEAALRRGDLPFFPPSGFSIHHELFPVPSFCTRTKRLCSDRLCLMEFCSRREGREKPGEKRTHKETRTCPFLHIIMDLSSCVSANPSRQVVHTRPDGWKEWFLRSNHTTNAICGPKKHVRKHALEHYSMSNPSWADQDKQQTLLSASIQYIWAFISSTKTQGPIVKHL